MKPDLIAAAEALADTLAIENAALASLDLRGAAAIFPRKDAAAAAFTAAQDYYGVRMTAALDAEQQRLARELAERLRGLAEENKRLLERAIRVQSHVLGTIARAVSQIGPQAEPRYGARGAPAEARRQPAVMLSARA